MKKSTIIIVAIFVSAMVIAFRLNQSYALSDPDEYKKWDVYFSNMKVSDSNGNVYVPEMPEVDLVEVKAYDVIISGPNDYVTHTFDIVNDGDVAARISSIIKEKPKCVSIELPENIEDAELVCKNLEYKYYYTDSKKEVTKNDIIEPHTKRNVTILVGIKSSSNIELNSEVQVILYDSSFNIIEKQSL